jgi:hypothetical protein
MRFAFFSMRKSSTKPSPSASSSVRAPSSPSSPSSDLPVSGVSIEHLHALLKRRPDMLAWDVDQFCVDFVKPLTFAGQCSYAEFLQRDPNQRQCASPQATFFVSYTRSTLLGDVLGALHGVSGFMWMDVLVINQHDRQAVNLKNGALGRALKTIGKMYVVAAPWHQPTFVQRIWCVYEHFQAVKNGVDVQIVMPPREKEALMGAMKKGLAFGFFVNLIARINVLNAEAKDSADQVAIMGLVQEADAHVVNQATKSAIKQWLAGIANECNVATAPKEASNVWFAMGALYEVSVRFTPLRFLR